MSEFKIGDKIVAGDRLPPFIVADACNNHLGNMFIAEKMIDMAALAGADCIKFQHHIPSDCMLPSIQKQVHGMSLYDFLNEVEFTIDQHKHLMEYCKDRDILYICTPFGYEAAKQLDGIDVPAFKIGSGEVTDIHFLKYVASFGKPMIISTGMCTDYDIDAIKDVMGEDDNFALLHCLSEYPPKFSHFRLQIIRRLQSLFPDRVIGFSDHAKVNYASFAAAAIGAGIIEKHFILGSDIPGPDQDESVDYAGLHDLVVGCRCIHMATRGGDLKQLSEEESDVAKWAHRSVVATRDIPAGSVITREMLTTKRPGDGVPANCLDRVVGSIAINNIRENAKIRWEDFRENSRAI